MVVKPLKMYAGEGQKLAYKTGVLWDPKLLKRGGLGRMRRSKAGEVAASDGMPKDEAGSGGKRWWSLSVFADKKTHMYPFFAHSADAKSLALWYNVIPNLWYICHRHSAESVVYYRWLIEVPPGARAGRAGGRRGREAQQRLKHPASQAMKTE